MTIILFGSHIADTHPILKQMMDFPKCFSKNVDDPYITHLFLCH